MLTRRRFLQGAAAGFSGPLLARIAIADDEAPLDIADEPQLFLDDWIVAHSKGLTRSLHPPEKHGLIKHADGSDWDRGDVYHGNIVCRDDDGRFHMTYRYMWGDPSVRDLSPNIGDDKAHWFRESVAYATSSDGIHWTRPELGLIEGPSGFRKQSEYPFLVPTGTSRDNNLGCPFDFIYDLHAHGNLRDPGKRFLLRTGTRDDTHPFAELRDPRLWYAPDWPDFARDPNWQKKLTAIPGGNLSPRGFRSVAGFDHQAKTWFAVSQDLLHNWIPRGGRDIARYHSPDLVTWTGPELVLPVADDESKSPDDYVEYMDLMAYRIGGEKSGAWLGQLTVFHGDRTSPQHQMPNRENVWRKGTTELRLVISRDAGKSWQRVCGRQTWLPHHPDPHGYDRLVFSSYPVTVGREQWLYYSAWDGDHLVFNRDGTLFEPGFARTGRTARATFRRDGYVSLDAGPAAAELVTHRLKFTGAESRVNVTAKSGGLRVELQDPAAKPLPGFALEDCTPVTGDHTSAPITWRGGNIPRGLAAGGIRVRFILTNTSFYGFRSAESSSIP